LITLRLHPARSAALGHEPFGIETCRRAQVESLEDEMIRVELLGPYGAHGRDPPPQGGHLPICETVGIGI